MSFGGRNPPVRSSVNLPVYSPLHLRHTPSTTPFVRGRSQPFPPPISRGYPEHPFVRGRSQPFPPPAGRNYPRHPYPHYREPNQALSLPLPLPPVGRSIIREAAEPPTTRPVAQQDSSSPLPQAPASRRVHFENLGGDLASADVQTRSELEKYFDVELWGWHLTPSDFQLGTCWLGTSELGKRDGDQEVGRKRRKGISKFQRFRLMFTRGILKSRKSNNKDREGEARRSNLKDTISAPLKSRIL